MLRTRPAQRPVADAPAPARPRAPPRDGNLSVAAPSASPAHDYEPAGELKIGQVGIANLRVRTLDVARLAAGMADRVKRAPKLFARAARSEEHTSELQSLMRISYAVFCLKKKK